MTGLRAALAAAIVIGVGAFGPAREAAAAEASTAQLMSFVVESLATDEEVVIPDELRRRTGEIIGFAPTESGEPLERIAAAFARCHDGKDCAAAIGFLRKKAAELTKKSARLKHPEALQLLSLLPQDGFAAWADALPAKDAGDREAIELAKRRHANLSQHR